MRPGARALGHVDRHLQRGRPGALADTGLQHPELALVDRELGVAHVGVVLFESQEDLQQLGVDHREVLLHVVEVLGVADTRHHVLALGVHEEVAVRLVLTGGGVAREPHARARVVVTVPEHHGLHVDRRAEVVIDLLPDAIGDGPCAVPALEHGLDRTVELLARLLGERGTGGLLHDRLELDAQLLEDIGGDEVVGGDAGLRLRRIERVLERLTVDAEHDAAVHGDEATVRVVREASIGGDVGQTFDTHVVQAQVEDGVHHSRHRELRARTAR